jgi:hypothetical protein
MPPPLFTQLDGLIPLLEHEHVAVLYRGRAHAFRWSSFLAEGLERHHLCYYLGPRPFHAEVLAGLRAHGLQVDRYLRSGALRLHEGFGDFRALKEHTRQIFLDAERVAAPALRWLEEGSWPQAVGFPLPQFFDFHALLNYQVKHYPSVALCQYDLEETAPHNLFSAMAVHRHLILGETLVRDNPFYIPAEKFLPLTPEERERDLAGLFREVGFDVDRLLTALVGYAKLGREDSRS